MCRVAEDQGLLHTGEAQPQMASAASPGHCCVFSFVILGGPATLSPFLRWNQVSEADNKCGWAAARPRKRLGVIRSGPQL